MQAEWILNLRTTDPITSTTVIFMKVLYELELLKTKTDTKINPKIAQESKWIFSRSISNFFLLLLIFNGT